MHHEYAFGWFIYMASANKSKMAAAAIFNFGKMSITPDWIKIYVPNFMERCTTAILEMTT